MSRADIDDYFAHLPEWMKNDILREIQLARASFTEAGRASLAQLGITAGGGNLLAALGLIAYTDALGQFRVWNRTRTYGSSPDECFLAFFDSMEGDRYRTWRLTWEHTNGISLWDALRSGMIHEYRPKVSADFWIGDGDDLGLADKPGGFIFKVEPYYRHFSLAAAQLYEDLKRLPDPQVPPPLLKPYTGGGTVPTQTFGSTAFRPAPIPFTNRTS